MTLKVPRALIKAAENKIQIKLEFNPNVENTQLKGIRGNWETAIAYHEQK